MSCPKKYGSLRCCVKSAIADIEPPFEPLVSIAILFKSSASHSSGVLGVIASKVRFMVRIINIKEKEVACWLVFRTLEVDEP